MARVAAATVDPWGSDLCRRKPSSSRQAPVCGHGPSRAQGRQRGREGASYVRLRLPPHVCPLLPALNSSSALELGVGGPVPTSWGVGRGASPSKPRLGTVVPEPVRSGGASGQPLPPPPLGPVLLGPDPAKPLLSPLPALLPSPPTPMAPLPPPTFLKPPSGPRDSALCNLWRLAYPLQCLACPEVPRDSTAGLGYC